jgi:hypothetical protein
MLSFIALTTVVAIQIKDHKMTPERIELPAGSKAELVVTNADADTEEFESKSLRIEKLVPPGRSLTFKIGPLRSGSYDLFGDFHAETCKGTIVVP